MALGLPQYKVHILPLGSDILSRTDKQFDSLRLLYVGTLQFRRIEDTIVGFHRFFHDYRDQIQCSYKIIGSGYAGEEDNLRRLVTELGLQSVVQVLGSIPHDELSPYFDASNIGISYIPKTRFYDVQPPTKTFEYLLSGMAVVATSTSENTRVINNRNGVLVEDNAESFASGLKQIYDRREDFCSSSIRNEGRPYLWESIVNENLRPYLEQL
jgi:glycosyltransferase involved in cell wall biosynthesis